MRGCQWSIEMGKRQWSHRLSCHYWRITQQRSLDLQKQKSNPYRWWICSRGIQVQAAQPQGMLCGRIYNNNTWKHSGRCESYSWLQSNYGSLHWSHGQLSMRGHNYWNMRYLQICRWRTPQNLWGFLYYYFIRYSTFYQMLDLQPVSKWCYLVWGCLVREEERNRGNTAMNSTYTLTQSWYNTTQAVYITVMSDFRMSFIVSSIPGNNSFKMRKFNWLHVTRIVPSRESRSTRNLGGTGSPKYWRSYSWI